MQSQAYRSAMKSFPGAVTLIASGPVGERTGMTATAVCSLSDDPPSVLVCVNRSASPHPVIRSTGCFSVNVLSESQQDLALLFSQRTGPMGEARFAQGGWSVMATGAPVLDGAVVVLDCELVREHESKTHSIFIGMVRACSSQELDPLIYLRGRFAGLRLL